jgi:ABC-type transport system involved in cytochrome c biogenesis permease component
MIMRGNNTLSLIFIPVIYSYILEGTAIHVSTKRCEVPLRILLFVIIMPFFISSVKLRLSRLDGSPIDCLGFALQVRLASDIIDSEPVPECSRLW